MGGWVGGWVGDREVVCFSGFRMRCCGGWVDGWWVSVGLGQALKEEMAAVARRFDGQGEVIHPPTHLPTHPNPIAHSSTFEPPRSPLSSYQPTHLTTHPPTQWSKKEHIRVKGSGAALAASFKQENRFLKAYRQRAKEGKDSPTHPPTHPPHVRLLLPSNRRIGFSRHTGNERKTVSHPPTHPPTDPYTHSNRLVLLYPPTNP